MVGGKTHIETFITPPKKTIDWLPPKSKKNKLKKKKKKKIKKRRNILNSVGMAI